MTQLEKKLFTDCGPEESKTISGPMVRNSLTKLLHGFLLYNLPGETLYKFYNLQSACPHSPVNEPEKLIIHLWDENGVTSSMFINNLVKQIELLCIENKIQMYQKFKEFIYTVFSSGAFQAQIYGPVLKYLIGEIDIREHVFRAVSTVANLVFHNVSCKIISELISKSIHEKIFLIRQLYGDDDNGCAIDIELSFVFLAQILPVIFFLRPFSRYRIHVHEQRVEDLLWNNESMHFEKGELYINGQLYGRQKSLLDCDIRKLHDEISLTGCDRWPVTIIERDYICPMRKRVILKRGEIYGAPYSVVSISDIVQESLMGRYEAFIRDDTTNCFWSELEKKHQILFEMCKKTVHIIYDKLDQILIVNNTSVVGGVQAKIFSTILKLFISKHRNIFEWRDLAANDELICDPYSTGLSTRLSRLIETLKRLECGCNIEKIARGKYKLVCNHEIVYKEKN